VSVETMSPTGRNLKHIVRALIGSQEFAVLIGLVAICAFFALATPTFLTWFNVFQNLRQIAMLGIIATGMTFVIAMGEIDISVGSTYNLAANIMAILIAKATFDPAAAAFVALLVGLLAGVANGLLAVVLRLPTLIVTLGTLSLYRGLTILISGGLSIGNLPESSFYELGSGGIGLIPYIALVALAISVAAGWALRNTIFARQVLAIGSNVRAAQRTGIRIGLRKIQVMAISGLLCGIAAVLGMSYLRSASPQSGVGFELLAIAAVVVGGTPMQGGTGTVWGTLIGIALIVIIQDGLILLGLPATWQITATGAMILLAVAIQQIVRKRMLSR